jgi:hypothetical protein
MHDLAQEIQVTERGAEQFSLPPAACRLPPAESR